MILVQMSLPIKMGLFTICYDISDLKKKSFVFLYLQHKPQSFKMYTSSFLFNLRSTVVIVMLLFIKW